MLNDQRCADGAIDTAALLAILLAIVRVEIVERHIHDVLVGVHHRADPEFSLRGDEEEFVTSHAGPVVRLVPQQLQLIAQDRFVRVNFFAGTFPLDHRFDKRLELCNRAALDAKPICRIGVHESHFGRNAARQSGLKHGARFRQRVFANDAGDVQRDLRVAKVIELWQHRLERLFRDRTGCHAIDADLHRLEARIFECAQLLAREQETVCRSARRETQLATVAHQLDNIWMRERFAADERDPHRAEFANFAGPLLQVIERRMRTRVVVLRAIGAIEIASIRHVQAALQRSTVDQPLRRFEQIVLAEFAADLAQDFQGIARCYGRRKRLSSAKSGAHSRCIAPHFCSGRREHARFADNRDALTRAPANASD